MKAAYVLFGLVCVSVLFVSMTVAAEVAQDKPMDGKIEGELAKGRCVNGCCSRNLLGNCKVCCASDGKIEGELAKGRCINGCCSRNLLGNCKVCCASAEEAKVAAAVGRGGFRAYGGGHGAGEAQEKEAKP